MWPSLLLKANVRRGHMPIPLPPQPRSELCSKVALRTGEGSSLRLQASVRWHLRGSRCSPRVNRQMSGREVQTEQGSTVKCIQDKNSGHRVLASSAVNMPERLGCTPGTSAGPPAGSEEPPGGPERLKDVRDRKTAQQTRRGQVIEGNER